MGLKGWPAGRHPAPRGMFLTIAEQVGVSRNTVSLKLRGNAGVADGTRDRVLVAAKELQ